MMRFTMVAATAAMMAACTSGGGTPQTLQGVCNNLPLAAVAFTLFSDRLSPDVRGTVTRAMDVARGVCANPPADAKEALARVLTEWLRVRGALSAVGATLPQ